MKKIGFLLFVSLFLIVTPLVVGAKDSNDNYSNKEGIKVAESDVAVFNNGNINTIKSDDQFKGKAESFEINYSNGDLKLSLDINKLKEPVDLNVSLLTGQLDYFKNNVLLGVENDLNDPYELVSFRIEDNATTDTLLKPNLDFEGNTVLNIGVMDTNTNNIYYLQQSVDNLNINQMKKDAKTNLKKDEHSKQDVRNLELKYLLLGEDLNKVGEVRNDSSTDSSESSSYYEVNDNNTQGTVDPRIPDGIFKSGPFEEWQQKTNWDDDAPYTYSYVTFRFAGTENRVTYIVLLNLKRSNNFSTQEFSFNFDLAENVSMLYNVYNEELHFFGDDNRLRINDITTHNRAKEPNDGILWSREYAGRTTGTKLKNIGEAAIQWFDWANKVKTTLEKLTASDQTKTGTDKYTYYDTVKGQKKANEGQIIKEMHLTDSGSLKNDNDYLLIESRGTDVSTINQGFKSTVEYK